MHILEGFMSLHSHALASHIMHHQTSQGRVQMVNHIRGHTNIDHAVDIHIGEGGGEGNATPIHATPTHLACTNSGKFLAQTGFIS